MEAQQNLDYYRIAEAIEYIRLNFKEQPKLEEIAAKVNLSSYHFQRMFTEWAGISPKKFLQYITLEHAKSVLKNERLSLFDAAYESGLSGTGRLYDLFVNIEGMTPAEYKNGGEALCIKYSFAESPFGRIVMASTQKGICYSAFVDGEGEGLQKLVEHFPNARLVMECDLIQDQALSIFNQDWTSLPNIKLHLKGTDFQIKVWETLLKIPMGQLVSYGSIAEHIQHPKASRAVGTAIGSNPVAFLIPCHRVIRSNGTFEGYMWGTTRKTAIIGWEASKISS